MFDVKLKDDSLNLDSQVASFDPDIGSLVTFKDGRNEFMRNKTQILMLQNYELVKQKMLTSLDGTAGDVFSIATQKSKQQAVIDAKLSGYGFLAGFI